MIGKRARRGFYKRKPTQQQLEHQNATTRLTVHSHLTMADPPAARSCTVCRKDSGISCCGRCKSTSYCSKECQKSDWRMHKLLCDSFSKFPVSSRPTPDHIHAVLFDPDEAKPKFIWLRCTLSPTGNGSCQLPEYAGVIDSRRSTTTVRYNEGLKRPTANTMVIAFRDSFFVDGSKSNKSVVCTSPLQSAPWL
jgi:hypothetical protein